MWLWSNPFRLDLKMSPQYERSVGPASGHEWSMEKSCGRADWRETLPSIIYLKE